MASAKTRHELTNVDVVVYALGLLDGARRSVHSEEVAAKCFELAPERFCWRLPQYRHYPDKYIAKTTLEDAKKRELGHLVDGRYAVDPRRDGWRLTADGARWLQANMDWLEEKLRARDSLQLGRQPGLPRQEYERFRRQIEQHPLYRAFREKGSLSLEDWYQLADLLHCRPDAPRDVAATKFDKLRSTAELARVPQILHFLNTCAQVFPQLTGGSSAQPSPQEPMPWPS